MEESPHILVVDDDRRLRDLLQRFLSESGFRVTVADSASQAREKLESFQFDLLVLDVMMPGESGLDLTSGLRETNPVPILLLTAMAEPDSAPSTVDSEIDRMYWRPRTRPTSLSMESSSTSIQPDLNRISPSRIKSGTVPRDAVVPVS